MVRLTVDSVINFSSSSLSSATSHNNISYHWRTMNGIAWRIWWVHILLITMYFCLSWSMQLNTFFETVEYRWVGWRCINQTETAWITQSTPTIAFAISCSFVASQQTIFKCSFLIVILVTSLTRATTSRLRSKASCITKFQIRQVHHNTAIFIQRFKIE
jgi:hypothetical protein